MTAQRTYKWNLRTLLEMTVEFDDENGEATVSIHGIPGENVSFTTTQGSLRRLAHELVMLTDDYAQRQKDNLLKALINDTKDDVKFMCGPWSFDTNGKK